MNLIEHIGGSIMIGLIIFTSLMTAIVLGYISGVIFYFKQGLGLFSFGSWLCWFAMKCFHI